MEKEYTKPELEVISLTSLSDFLMGSAEDPKEEEGNVNEGTWNGTGGDEFGGGTGGNEEDDGWI
jgi:hypothetical protein